VGSKTYDGVRFSVYPNDHLPPHVHGSTGGTRVILDLMPDGTVARSKRIDAVSKKAKRNAVAKIERVAAENAAELTALWEKIHGDR
jgi:hypothetical protein